MMTSRSFTCVRRKCDSFLEQPMIGNDVRMEWIGYNITWLSPQYKSIEWNASPFLRDLPNFDRLYLIVVCCIVAVVLCYV